MIYSRWSLQANISLLMRTWLLSTRQALFLENTRSLMISRYDRDGSFASIPSTIHNATIWWRSRVFLFVLLVAWILKNDWRSKNGLPMDWSAVVDGPGGGKTKRRKPAILLCSYECSDDILIAEFATRALHSLLTGECCCISISISSRSETYDEDIVSLFDRGCCCVLTIYLQGNQEVGTLLSSVSEHVTTGNTQEPVQGSRHEIVRASKQQFWYNIHL